VASATDVAALQDSTAPDGTRKRVRRETTVASSKATAAVVSPPKDAKRKRTAAPGPASAEAEATTTAAAPSSAAGTQSATPKDGFSSRNAYMLIYCRRGARSSEIANKSVSDEALQSRIPLELRAEVDRDNQQLEALKEAYNTRRQVLLQEVCRKL